MENVAVKNKRKPRPSLRNIEAKFSELKTWQRVRIKSNIKIDQWAVREDFQKWMDEHANCAWEVVRGCKTAGSPADFPCYVYLKRPNKKLVLLLALTWSSQHIALNKAMRSLREYLNQTIAESSAEIGAGDEFAFEINEDISLETNVLSIDADNLVVEADHVMWEALERLGLLEAEAEVPAQPAPTPVVEQPVVESSPVKPVAATTPKTVSEHIKSLIDIVEAAEGTKHKVEVTIADAETDATSKETITVTANTKEEAMKNARKQYEDDGFYVEETKYLGAVNESADQLNELDILKAEKNYVKMPDGNFVDIEYRETERMTDPRNPMVTNVEIRWVPAQEVKTLGLDRKKPISSAAESPVMVADPAASNVFTFDSDALPNTVKSEIAKWVKTHPAAQSEGLAEAEYQGRTVQLGKPMRGDVRKYKVFVKDPKTGNVKKVNFGDPGMEIKRDDPERRRNFRARHGCGTSKASDRTKARYWSCRMWSKKSVGDILKGK